MVDTQGLVLKVKVLPADITDAEGGYRRLGQPRGTSVICLLTVATSASSRSGSGEL